MIKYFFYIIIVGIVGFPFLTIAGTCNSTSCTGSSPWTAASASYADVNHCVNTCSTYGDVVNVPAGSVTWTNTLALTKNISLSGAGIDTTIIKSTQTYIISYIPDATARTNEGDFYISGFTLDADGNGIVGIYIRNSTSTDVSKIKIYSNKFIDFYPTGTGIMIQGSLFGVAYNNQFDNVGIVARVLGAATSADGLVQWENLSQSYGTVNNFFIENNTIGFSAPFDPGEYAGWIELGRGGKGVVRYNAWTNPTDEIWDVHGLQSVPELTPNSPVCEQYATIIAEFYGNSITGAANKRWMYHRGSWLLMYFNEWAGTTGTTINYGQYGCDACAKYGYGTGQHINNTYLWSNISQGSSNVSMTKGIDICGDNLDPSNADYYSITANRDYYNYNASFDGTTGVGCGTIANLPATCTTGVSYWATNQSCSDMTGLVGASPATPISGNLYKCTATNTWTAYYTPYTYPHPLRGEAPVDTSAPVITAFTIPATTNSPTIAVTMTATDDVGVSHYLITQSATAPVAGDFLSATPLETFTMTNQTGTSETLYAWAKDAADNISASLSANIIINYGFRGVTLKR